MILNYGNPKNYKIQYLNFNLVNYISVNPYEKSIEVHSSVIQFQDGSKLYTNHELFFRSIGSFALELNIFGQLIEICALCQCDDQFWVYLSVVFKFDVLAWNWLNDCESILSQNLSVLGNQWNGFTHAFDLYWPMLFHDYFTQEQSLVQAAVLSDSEDVWVIDRFMDLCHFVCWKLGVN